MWRYYFPFLFMLPQLHLQGLKDLLRWNETLQANYYEKKRKLNLPYVGIVFMKWFLISDIPLSVHCFLSKLVLANEYPKLLLKDKGQRVSYLIVFWLQQIDVFKCVDLLSEMFVLYYFPPKLVHDCPMNG